MTQPLIANALLGAALVAGMPAVAQAPGPAPVPAPVPATLAAADPYDSPDAWLCRPGRADLCSGPVLRTAVQTDGSTSAEAFAANPTAPIDCFYVYPTISLDPDINSGLTAGPGEQRAVSQQFAAFASVCRPYAPMYRQVTLAGLRAILQPGSSVNGVQAMASAYASIRAAWQHYLQHDNQGRGVVLIGHSQGTLHLITLLDKEIAGTPSAKLLVSAVLAGYNYNLPAGGEPRVPLCTSAQQTGCAIPYVSFKADSPPPPNAMFGRAQMPGAKVACVDPVALSGRPVDSFLPVKANLLGAPWRGSDWQRLAGQVQTPFVHLPGLLQARCVSDEGAGYLALSPSGTGDKRPADIPAELISGGRMLDTWGWHLVDINAVMGNLLTVVKRQSEAYTAGR